MSENWKVEMGSRIGLLREKKGFTPDAFAKMLGVSRPTVVNWENGKRSPDCEKLALIAVKLNTTMDYLNGITTNPLPPETVANVEDLVANMQLTYKDKPLTDKQKKMFLKFFETVAEYDE
ncbi:helix-turn-helix domain-containing protein [Priestia flexa]|uniref:helix-turn-helix domain-containing protein n=1 Tax=Priestia flexa TaxID=86664 RepID=UPI003CFD123F